MLVELTESEMLEIIDLMGLAVKKKGYDAAPSALYFREKFLGVIRQQSQQPTQPVREQSGDDHK